MSRAEPGSECSVLPGFRSPRQERADGSSSCYGGQILPQAPAAASPVQRPASPLGPHCQGLGSPVGHVHRHWVKPQGFAHPTLPHALPQNAGAKWAKGLSRLSGGVSGRGISGRGIWQGYLAAPGPDHRLAITAEPFQLPLRGRNKAQLVSHSHQLILIDTTLHSESSTRSQFTFLLNHTGKLEALLLPSNSIRVLCSPTIHRVGKHPGISGLTVSSQRSPPQSIPFA